MEADLHGVSPRTSEIFLPDDLAAEVASAVQLGEYASESDAGSGQSRNGAFSV